MQHLDADTLRWVYRIVIIVAAIASAAVVFTYHFLSDGAWRDSPLGRNLFGSDSTLLVLLLWSIFASFVSDKSKAVVFAVSIALFVAYIYFRIDRAMLMWRSEKVRRGSRDGKETLFSQMEEEGT